MLDVYQEAKSEKLTELTAQFKQSILKKDGWREWDEYDLEDYLEEECREDEEVKEQLLENLTTILEEERNNGE